MSASDYIFIFLMGLEMSVCWRKSIFARPEFWNSLLLLTIIQVRLSQSPLSGWFTRSDCFRQKDSLCPFT